MAMYLHANLHAKNHENPSRSFVKHASQTDTHTLQLSTKEIFSVFNLNFNNKFQWNYQYQISIFNTKFQWNYFAILDFMSVHLSLVLLLLLDNHIVPRVSLAFPEVH